MRTQLRLVQIRNEIEVLENPVLRKTYEELHVCPKNTAKNLSSNEPPNTFVVMKKDKISKQIDYINMAKTHVDADAPNNFVMSLKVCSLIFIN